MIITRATWDAGARQATANAIVPGTVVSGGTCTLTLSHGSQTQTVARAATATADSTQCGVLSIAGDVLAPGSWTAVVTFTAPGVSGTSNSSAITVTG